MHNYLDIILEYKVWCGRIGENEHVWLYEENCEMVNWEKKWYTPTSACKHLFIV